MFLVYIFCVHFLLSLLSKYDEKLYEYSLKRFILSYSIRMTSKIILKVLLTISKLVTVYIDMLMQVYHA